MIKKKAAWVVLALVFGLMLAGCSDDSSASGIVGLISPEPVQSLQNFTGTMVASEDEARELFKSINYASNFFEILLDAESEAFEAAFETKYDMDMMSYMAEKMNQKSASFSVNLNDSRTFPDYSNITAGKISGSQTSSVSLTNLTIGDFFDNSGGNLINDGDKATMITTGKRTFAITDGFAEFQAWDEISGSWQTFNAAGYISTDYTGSQNSTLVDADKGIYQGSNNSVSKVAVTLTVSNGTKGAKFRFSASNLSNSTMRNVTSRDEENISDLEVYDNSNTLRYTITGDRLDYYNFVDFADEAANNDLPKF